MPSSHSSIATTNRQYAVALSRAFAGAMLFCLPLLMTMEMWWFGFTLHPLRLLQFSLINMAMLFGLSRIAGFEESQNWLDDLLDAFAAYAVGAITVTAILFLVGAIGPQMPLSEIAGKIAIQAIPASFGAMIGARLMGEGEQVEQREHWRRTYQGQLFLMLAGALFMSFTVAPTEEIILIAFQMSSWHGLAMIALSILLLHAILYLVGFRGQEQRSAGNPRFTFVRQTLPGYAIAIGASIYILWTLGRTDGLDLAQVAMSAVVLGFPASIGAGIARIVV